MFGLWRKIQAATKADLDSLEDEIQYRHTKLVSRVQALEQDNLDLKQRLQALEDRVKTLKSS